MFEIKIPDIIRADGIEPVMHIAQPEEYVRFLLQKVREEADELIGAEGLIQQKEELADLREVMLALQRALGISDEEIESIQDEKALKRGAFNQGVIIDEQP